MDLPSPSALLHSLSVALAMARAGRPRGVPQLSDVLEIACTTLCMVDEGYARHIDDGDYAKVASEILDFLASPPPPPAANRHAQQSKPQRHSRCGTTSTAAAVAAPFSSNVFGSSSSPAASASPCLTLCLRFIALLIQVVPTGSIRLADQRYRVVPLFAQLLINTDYLLENEEGTEELLRCLPGIAPHAHGPLISAGVLLMLCALEPVLGEARLRRKCLVAVSEILARSHLSEWSQLKPAVASLLDNFAQRVDYHFPEHSGGGNDFSVSGARQASESSFSSAAGGGGVGGSGSRRGSVLPCDRAGSPLLPVPGSPSGRSQSTAAALRAPIREEQDVLVGYVQCLGQLCDRVLTTPAMLKRCSSIVHLMTVMLTRLFKGVCALTDSGGMKGGSGGGEGNSDGGGDLGGMAALLAGSRRQLRYIALSPLVSLYYSSPAAMTAIFLDTRLLDVASSVVAQMLDRSAEAVTAANTAAAESNLLEENARLAAANGGGGGGGARLPGTVPAVASSSLSPGTAEAPGGGGIGEHNPQRHPVGNPAMGAGAGNSSYSETTLSAMGSEDDDVDDNSNTALDTTADEATNTATDGTTAVGTAAAAAEVDAAQDETAFTADERATVPLTEFLLAVIPPAPSPHSSDDYLSLTFPLHAWTWDDDFHNSTECGERMCRFLACSYGLFRARCLAASQPVELAPIHRQALALTLNTHRKIFINMATQEFVGSGNMFPHALNRCPVSVGFVHLRQEGVSGHGACGACMCLRLTKEQRKRELRPTNNKPATSTANGAGRLSFASDEYPSGAAATTTTPADVRLQSSFRSASTLSPPRSASRRGTTEFNENSSSGNSSRSSSSSSSVTGTDILSTLSGGPRRPPALRQRHTIIGCGQGPGGGSHAVADERVWTAQLFAPAGGKRSRGLGGGNTSIAAATARVRGMDPAMLSVYPFRHRGGGGGAGGAGNRSGGGHGGTVSRSLFSCCSAGGVANSDAAPDADPRGANNTNNSADDSESAGVASRSTHRSRSRGSVNNATTSCTNNTFSSGSRSRGGGGAVGCPPRPLKDLFADAREDTVTARSTRDAYLTFEAVQALLSTIVPSVVNVVKCTVSPLIARHCCVLLLRCLSLTAQFCCGGDLAAFTRPDDHHHSGCGGGGGGPKLLKPGHHHTRLVGDMLRAVGQQLASVLTYLLTTDDGADSPEAGLTTARAVFSTVKDEEEYGDALAEAGLGVGFSCHTFTMKAERRLAAVDALCILIRLSRLFGGDTRGAGATTTASRPASSASHAAATATTTTSAAARKYRLSMSSTASHILPESFLRHQRRLIARCCLARVERVAAARAEMPMPRRASFWSSTEILEQRRPPQGGNSNSTTSKTSHINTSGGGRPLIQEQLLEAADGGCPYHPTEAALLDTYCAAHARLVRSLYNQAAQTIPALLPVAAGSVCQTPQTPLAAARATVGKMLLGRRHTSGPTPAASPTAQQRLKAGSGGRPDMLSFRSGRSSLSASMPVNVNWTQEPPQPLPAAHAMPSAGRTYADGDATTPMSNSYHLSNSPHTQQQQHANEVGSDGSDGSNDYAISPNDIIRMPNVRSGGGSTASHTTTNNPLVGPATKTVEEGLVPSEASKASTPSPVKGKSGGGGRHPALPTVAEMVAVLLSINEDGTTTPTGGRGSGSAALAEAGGGDSAAAGAVMNPLVVRPRILSAPQGGAGGGGIRPHTGGTAPPPTAGGEERSPYSRALIKAIHDRASTTLAGVQPAALRAVLALQAHLVDRRADIRSVLAQAPDVLRDLAAIAATWAHTRDVFSDFAEVCPDTDLLARRRCVPPPAGADLAAPVPPTTIATTTRGSDGAYDGVPELLRDANAFVHCGRDTRLDKAAATSLLDLVTGLMSAVVEQLGLAAARAPNRTAVHQLPSSHWLATYEDRTWSAVEHLAASFLHLRFVRCTAAAQTTGTPLPPPPLRVSSTQGGVSASATQQQQQGPNNPHNDGNKDTFVVSRHVTMRPRSKEIVIFGQTLAYIDCFVPVDSPAGDEAVVFPYSTVAAVERQLAQSLLAVRVAESSSSSSPSQSSGPWPPGWLFERRAPAAILGDAMVPEPDVQRCMPTPDCPARFYHRSNRRGASKDGTEAAAFFLGPDARNISFQRERGRSLSLVRVPDKTSSTLQATIVPQPAAAVGGGGDGMRPQGCLDGNILLLIDGVPLLNRNMTILDALLAHGGGQSCHDIRTFFHNASNKQSQMMAGELTRDGGGGRSRSSPSFGAAAGSADGVDAYGKSGVGKGWAYQASKVLRSQRFWRDTHRVQLVVLESPAARQSLEHYSACACCRNSLYAQTDPVPRWPTTTSGAAATTTTTAAAATATTAEDHGDSLESSGGPVGLDVRRRSASPTGRGPTLRYTPRLSVDGPNSPVTSSDHRWQQRLGGPRPPPLPPRAAGSPVLQQQQLQRSPSSAAVATASAVVVVVQPPSSSPPPTPTATHRSRSLLYARSSRPVGILDPQTRAGQPTAAAAAEAEEEWRGSHWLLCSVFHYLQMVREQGREPLDPAFHLLSVITRVLRAEGVELPMHRGEQRRMSASLLHDLSGLTSAIRVTDLATFVAPSLVVGGSARGHLAAYALFNHPAVFSFEMRVLVVHLLTAKRLAPCDTLGAASAAGVPFRAQLALDWTGAAVTPQDRFHAAVLAAVLSERRRRRQHGGDPSRDSSGAGGGGVVVPLLGLQFPQSPAHSIRVSPSNILAEGCALLRRCADAPVALGFHFQGQQGIGLGPTLEFYERLGEALAAVDPPIWRTVEVETMEAANDGGGGASSPATARKRVTARLLYPCATLRTADAAYHYESLGILVGLLVRMGRTTSVRFHPLFLRAVLGQCLVSEESDMMRMMAALDSETETYLRGLEAMSPRDLEACELENTLPAAELPADRPLYLSPDGRPQLLTRHNIAAYTRAVREHHLNTILQDCAHNFKAGLAASIDPFHLQLFSAEELGTLFSGRTGKIWETPAAFAKDVVAAHGYTKISRVVQSLIQLIPSWSVRGQREFLRFVTGASALPVKGLPFPIKVVCRHVAGLTGDLAGPAAVAAAAASAGGAAAAGDVVGESGNDSDLLALVAGSANALSSLNSAVNLSFGSRLAGCGGGGGGAGGSMQSVAVALRDEIDRTLPTVGTCFHYLRLPEYSSAAVLEERLKYAIRESAGTYGLT